MRFKSKYLRYLLKDYSYHTVFIISLLTLTALVTWWAVFVNRSIHDSYDLHKKNLKQGLLLYASTMGQNKTDSPKVGILIEDQRFEIVSSVDSLNRQAVKLSPVWSSLYIQPREEILLEREEKLKSQQLMVVGESGLLLFLILISGFMIYRSHWLEKRVIKELHELWSRVSHEIKSPITGLKAFLETIRDEPMDHEKMKPLIRMALQNVERQKKLTENMLIGQKIKNGGFGINLKTIDVKKFILDYLDYESSVSAGKIIEFDTQGSDCYLADADPSALRVVFDNIIDNAYKYGGKDVSIAISIRHEGKKRVVIKFADSGPGFDPGMNDGIFRAYGRLSEELPKGQHGTGMGLYISRNLVRKWGGDMSARSRGPGKGSEFSIYLKRKRTRDYEKSNDS